MSMCAPSGLSHSAPLRSNPIPQNLCSRQRRMIHPQRARGRESEIAIGRENMSADRLHAAVTESMWPEFGAVGTLLEGSLELYSHLLCPKDHSCDLHRTSGQSCQSNTSLRQNGELAVGRWNATMTPTTFLLPEAFESFLSCRLPWLELYCVGQLAFVRFRHRRQAFAQTLVLIPSAETVGCNGKNQSRSYSLARPALLPQRSVDQVERDSTVMKARSSYDGPKQVLRKARLQVERDKKLGASPKDVAKSSPGHKAPSPKIGGLNLRELNECVKKCRLEIKEATKRFAGRPEREILSEKIKLCIELLHKTTSIVSKSCPKAGEIFRSTIHYIYPTPNVQESYGNMRQKFSKE
eukprot:jgi/Bigna1/87007/estExt_fgenesh1_pg.C_160004